MNPESITIRFPNGSWEYGIGETPPKIGHTMVREGQTWVVATVTTSVDGRCVVTMAQPRPDGGGP